MQTKLLAAQNAQRHGAATVIADGRQGGILGQILEGADVGSFIPGPSETPKKRAMDQLNLRPRGELQVDAGRIALWAVGLPCCLRVWSRSQVILMPATRWMFFWRENPHLSPEGHYIEREGCNAGGGSKSWDAQKSQNEPLPDELIHRDDLAFLG